MFFSLYNSNLIFFSSFLDFEVASSSTKSECSKDFVRVYNGRSIEDPLLGIACGSRVPYPVISTNDVLIVLRTIGWLRAKGFKLVYTYG